MNPYKSNSPVLINNGPLMGCLINNSGNVVNRTGPVTGRAIEISTTVPFYLKNVFNPFKSLMQNVNNSFKRLMKNVNKPFKSKMKNVNKPFKNVMKNVNNPFKSLMEKLKINQLVCLPQASELNLEILFYQ